MKVTRMSPYWALALAISAEVAATSALKATESFTRPIPSAIVVAGYAVAFYFLSVAVASIPVGVAYGIWSGLGIVLVSLVAFVLYQQSLTPIQVGGLLCIIVGVVLVNIQP
jgi:small multidrug resistance pump